MNTKYTLIWQKWIDPFGSESELFENSDTSNDDSDSSHYNDEESEDSNSVFKTHQQIVKSTRVIATPMGIIPIDENTASGKIFNFWLGHTNFNITQNICQIIENTPGVECLDIFTRYRFRIAIGKAFNAGETMNLVQNNIFNFLDTYYDSKEQN